MPEYIERDAALEAAKKSNLYFDIKPIINSIPAADVRPVVRGHWTNHRTLFTDGDWYCSACGKEITIYMGPDREDRYAYCPNCGADMREEGVSHG